MTKPCSATAMTLTKAIGERAPHLSPLPKGIPLRANGGRPHYPLARRRQNRRCQLPTANCYVVSVTE